MREVVEKYLTQAGSRRSFVLMGTAIVWGTIGLAVVLYVVLSGLGIIFAVSAAALDGGGTDIGIAVVVWIFLLLSCVLAHAGRHVWLQRRQRRWDAEVALDAIEAHLFSRDDSTAYRGNVRDRLAVRALNALEAKLLGAPASRDAGFEQRLIALRCGLKTPGRDATGADRRPAP